MTPEWEALGEDQGPVILYLLRKGDSMLEDSDQVQHRMLKLQRLRERGTEPYPARARRSHTAAEAIAAFEEAEASGSQAPTVHVTGRLRAIRVMGKSTFAHIEDGSGRIQIYLKREDLCHTGAHKVNNTLGQCLLAKKMGLRLNEVQIS